MIIKKRIKKGRARLPLSSLATVHIRGHMLLHICAHIHTQHTQTPLKGIASSVDIKNLAMAEASVLSEIVSFYCLCLSHLFILHTKMTTIILISMCKLHQEERLYKEIGHRSFTNCFF